MRFSWAVDGLGGLVICHSSTEDLYKYPYGICCPIGNACRWELIEILERQDSDEKLTTGARLHGAADDDERITFARG
jgi:hypothetical protein